MRVICGNYGDATIAMMQWAHEAGLSDVYVVSIDTSWGAERWQQRVTEGIAFTEQLGFTPVRLRASLGFADLTRDRGTFPSMKFQWCAGLLKGLPLMVWLDQQDPYCEATILLGKWRGSSRGHQHLETVIDRSPHYGERRVEHPLLDLTEAAYNALFSRAKWQRLGQRSLECEACVAMACHDFQHMQPVDIARVAALEAELGSTMFETAIAEQVAVAQAQAPAEPSGDNFDIGCGSPFGCGDL